MFVEKMISKSVPSNTEFIPYVYVMKSYFFMEGGTERSYIRNSNSKNSFERIPMYEAAAGKKSGPNIFYISDYTYFVCFLPLI